MHETFEMRIAADGSIPAPETIEENPTAYNYGEAVPNPDYVNAEFGVAFACGGEAYKALSIGPPPGAWTNTTLKKFANLSWNGRVDITQNVMVPLETAPNTANVAPRMDTNKRGDYIQLIASLVMGCLAVKRRNILPIIYSRRATGASNSI